MRPTAQRRVVRASRPVVYLRLLTLVGLVVAVQAFCKSNHFLPVVGPAWFWHLELLKLNEASTVLLTLLTLTILQTQFITNSQPYLITLHGRRDESVSALEMPVNESLVWQVVLKNAGPGVAVIRSMRFRVANAPGVHEGPFDLEYADVIERLRSQGIPVDDGVMLSNYTPGMAIGSKDQDVLFESAFSVATSIASLDLLMTYEGVLGDRYEKSVYLVPRPKTSTS